MNKDATILQSFPSLRILLNFRSKWSIPTRLCAVFVLYETTVGVWGTAVQGARTFLLQKVMACFRCASSGVNEGITRVHEN